MQGLRRANIFCLSSCVAFWQNCEKHRKTAICRVRNKRDFAHGFFKFRRFKGLGEGWELNVTSPMTVL